MPDVPVGHRDELDVVTLGRPEGRRPPGLELGIVRVGPENDDAQLAVVGRRPPGSVDRSPTKLSAGTPEPPVRPEPSMPSELVLRTSSSISFPQSHDLRRSGGKLARTPARMLSFLCQRAGPKAPSNAGRVALSPSDARPATLLFRAIACDPVFVGLRLCRGHLARDSRAGRPRHLKSPVTGNCPALLCRRCHNMRPGLVTCRSHDRVTLVEHTPKAFLCGPKK